MKKISSLLSVAGFIIVSISISAFAATTMFTDENSFADWYAPSVKKMQYNNIITGYEDGSFGGQNSVSRAELAVILDRYTANIVGQELKDGPIACTMEYAYGLNITLQDQNGAPLSGAQITSSPETEFSGELDNGQYSGIGEGEGYYTFTIDKEGYSSHTETIKLEQNACHVIPQIRTITLIAK